MTAQSWELSDLQRQAQAKRAEVAGSERILARLDEQHELASGAEAAYDERCRPIRARMDAIRFGPHPSRVVSHGSRRDVVSGPTDDELREYPVLEQQLRSLEKERARWLEDHTVRWSDGGVERSYGMTSASVGWQRDRVRVSRDVAASQLAALEGQLSAGERVQSGVTAPEYAQHRERVEALRARLG